MKLRPCSDTEFLRFAAQRFSRIMVRSRVVFRRYIMPCSMIGDMILSKLSVLWDLQLIWKISKAKTSIDLCPINYQSLLATCESGFSQNWALDRFDASCRCITHGIRLTSWPS